VTGTPKIAHRNDWDSYDAYVHDQGGKARGNRDELLAHMPRHVESFTTYFTNGPRRHLTPGPVLCLGARTGAESHWGHQGGVCWVGRDRSAPGRADRPSGRLARDPVPAATFANAYSNSLDHCLYLDRLTAEVTRVLSDRWSVLRDGDEPRRAHRRDAWHRSRSKSNEALYWQTSDDLAAAICGYGFEHRAVVA
jgi:hypothetical protein